MKALLSTLVLLAAFTGLPAASLPEAQKIDAILSKDWQKHNLKPNPAAPDEVIVRRLYLDIAGRIPTTEETQTFMKSGDPQKRAKLIDQLLASDGYTSNMFNYWADILRLTDNVKGKVTAQAYEEWLKQQLKANKPYDQMVRDLLTTEGGAWDSGSIGFYQRDENKLDHLAYTVQVFLGTQIVCAQCHNHPFDKWSQLDYYGMAAFTYGMDTRGNGVDFKTIKNPGKPQVDRAALKNMTKPERQAFMAERRKEGGGAGANAAGPTRQELQEVRKTLQDVLKPLRYTSIQWSDSKLPKLPNDYKYGDAKPGAEIAPKVLFGHDAVMTGVETRLQAFANWMAAPDNPRFTTVIANRMWKKAFGIGLIEPVDEMTDSTVPSNNELMEYLNQLMIEKKYSLKSFLRVLYNTEAYQRMATREEVPLGETYNFTGPVLRRMSAEQIWDSFVTLARGSADSAAGEKDERMHQYLTDLKFLIDTMKDKGPEGLVEIAKKGAADREATNEKLAALKKEMEAAQSSGNADQAGALAKQAARLRRENANDMLEAIVGDDRAEDLRRGYNPEKANKNARPAGLTREQLASMSKEQRRDAVKMGNSLNLTSRASEITSPARPGHLLRTFGQSDREQIQNASDEASVPQALALLNGPTTEVLNSPVSKLRQELEKATTPQARMDAIYLACLSRLPTNNERAVLNEVIHERGDRAYGDVIQAVLTGSQFVFVQ